MAVKYEGVTHWALPANDLAESERFYRDVLGMEYRGRLQGGYMACVVAGDATFLLCQRAEPQAAEEETHVHHSFIVSPDTWVEACKSLKRNGVAIDQLVYRDRGFFLGAELYFRDPSGNRIELRDATWQPGMPTPSYDEIVGSEQPASAG